MAGGAVRVLRAVVVSGALASSGCVAIEEVPLVSGAEVTTIVTLDELRAWVGEQLDGAVAVSGVSEGWSDLYWEDVFWSEHGEQRELLLSALLPQTCSDLGGGRLDVSLVNTGVADPFAVAERVRSFWEAEGWTVTDVSSIPSATEEYFRADRADGATLALHSIMDETGYGVVLDVATSCSAHHTVSNWDPYLEDEPGAEGEVPPSENRLRPAAGSVLRTSVNPEPER